MKKNLLKLGGALYFGFGFMLLFGVNAHAYIDPSVITYVIQAVAGIVMCTLIFFPDVFRRMYSACSQ